MQPNTQYCQPDLYSSYLHTIKGIPFTRRQVDILACLSTGRNAKAIAQFLGIDSERTIHAHELNIREKLGYGSRDSIINFLEKCDEFPALKKYHQILRTHFLFEKYAEKISHLGATLSSKLVIVCKDPHEDTNASLLKSLVYYLRQGGTKASIQQHVPLDDPYIILDTQPKTQSSKNQFMFDRKDLNSFYLNLIDLIEKQLPNTDLSTIKTAFKNEYTSIHQSEQSIVIQARDSVTATKYFQPRWRSFIKNRTGKTIATTFICFCIFGAWLLMGDPNSTNNLSKIQPIHSDLIIPNDAALLKRPDLIKRIEQKINSQKGIQTVALVGIVGMGGVGKTTLARHFGRLQKSSLVWELNAETKESLMNSFKDLAYALAKTKEEKEELELIKAIQNPEAKEKQLLIFVKEHLKAYQGWILIYDNIDAFEEAKDYLPQDTNAWGKGKVIITSRDQNIKNTNYINPDEIIELGELSPPETLELFTKIYYHGDVKGFSLDQKENIQNFLKHIPSFPLDVSIAAHYIKDVQISYKQYLEHIKRHDKDFEAAHTKFLKYGNEYERTRYGIISLSFRKLIESNPEFEDLLFFVCLIDSQNIPIILLESFKNPKTVNQFMRGLRQYSLITSESPPANFNTEYTFNLHRATQELGKLYILKTLKADERIKILDKITNTMNTIYKNQENKNQRILLILIPHLESFLKKLNTFKLIKKKKDSYNQDILAILGYLHLDISNNLAKSKQYLIQGYNLQDTTHYLSNSTLAFLLKELGRVQYLLNNNEEAITYCEKSINLYEREPDGSQWIVENLEYIGRIYRKLNNIHKAKNYYELALKNLPKVNSPLEKEIKSKFYISLSNFYSMTYLTKPQGIKAETYGIKALEMVDATNQLYNHPIEKIKKLSCFVVKYRISLGITYCHRGKYDEAWEQGFREAQYIIDNRLDDCILNYQKIIMDFHIGEIFLRKNNLKEAEAILTKSLINSKKLLEKVNNFSPWPAYTFRTESRIRLKKFKEAYEDCKKLLETDQKVYTNNVTLLYLMCHYHAAYIKYKQNDFKKSIEHFTDFFKNMQEFCKGFLEEKEFKELEAKSAFTILPYTSKTTKNDINNYLKNSVEIFTAIYGNKHPFVTDYIIPNYKNAIKPWWKFW